MHMLELPTFECSLVTSRSRHREHSMGQGSDEGAGAGHSAWPSGGDADTPVAPTAGAAAAMTLGSILTVAGILLLFVIFAFGLASLQYCFQRSERRRRGPRTAAGGSSSGGGTMRTTTSRGVDPELLRSLPVTVYHHGTSDHQQEAVECAVCLAELQDGEEARFLPRCGHGFHAECVDMWLASHTTCPLCRLTVSKPDDVSPHPVSSLALPPVPPEPASYATASFPVSVLLGVSGHDVVTAVTTDPSTLVIEIPELAVPTPTLTPCDAAAKSPGSARLRSIRRLWSFGRQGAGATSSSCSCAGAGASEGVDLEQGIS